jgi:hypothetical protein
MVQQQKMELEAMKAQRTRAMNLFEDQRNQKNVSCGNMVIPEKACIR